MVEGVGKRSEFKALQGKERSLDLGLRTQWGSCRCWGGIFWEDTQKAIHSPEKEIFSSFLCLCSEKHRFTSKGGSVGERTVVKVIALQVIDLCSILKLHRAP